MKKLVFSKTLYMNDPMISEVMKSWSNCWTDDADGKEVVFDEESREYMCGNYFIHKKWYEQKEINKLKNK